MGSTDLLWDSPVRVGAGDSEKVEPKISLEKSIVQCRSCPPFRIYLKIPMVVGTQAPMWRREYWLRVAMGVECEGVSSGVPHAHLLPGDLLSLPVLQSS